MERKKIIDTVPLVIFGALILILLVGLYHGSSGVSALQVGDAVPMTDVPTLGAQGARFSTRAWQGRSYVVNFFASWSADCKNEHEELMTLEAGQIPVIGVIFKDDTDKITAFLNRMGDPYAAIARDDDGQARKGWGVAGAPETFVVDGQGAVRWHHAGPLTDQVVSDELMPVWESVQSGQ